MKNFALYIFLTLSLLFAYSCIHHSKDTTRYYLVRHAEKAVDGTEDPDLSPAGQERARKLVSIGRENKVERLYATSYKRTQQTLQPLSDSLHLEITLYDHEDAEDVKRMIGDSKGKTVVIAGHSNSIPRLANILIGEEIYQALDENDYAKMWEITWKGEKVAGHRIIIY